MGPKIKLGNSTGFFILGLFVGFILCIVFSIYYHWFCNIFILNEVAPVDIISIVITSFIAIYLGYLGQHITKRLSEQRFEKEFLVNDLKDIESKTTAITLYLRQSGTKNVSEVAENMTILRNSIDHFIKTAEIMEVKINGFTLEKLFTVVYFMATDQDRMIALKQKMNDPLLIQQHCENLIIEVRKLVHQINCK